MTKRWSDKGEPDLVALSSETFKGSHEVTFGEPKGNEVVVTVRAAAERTWWGRHLRWRESSETAWRKQTSTFICDRDNGEWDETLIATPHDAKHVFARVDIDHGIIKTENVSRLLIRVGGKYGYDSSYMGTAPPSQETGDWSTTYTCRYGLVPDSPSK